MTVAAETGTDVAVLLDRPLWLVLWTYLHLMERASRRALQDRMARVDSGHLTAVAFSEKPGEILTRELASVRAAIDAFEYGEEDVSPDVLRQQGRALAQRIMAGRALAPEALVS